MATKNYLFILLMFSSSLSAAEDMSRTDENSSTLRRRVSRLVVVRQPSPAVATVPAAQVANATPVGTANPAKEVSFSCWSYFKMLVTPKPLSSSEAPNGTWEHWMD